MAEYLKGGWFPEAWDIPVALGLGVVITGFMGDYVAGWISQYIPAEWLNPTSEIIIGVILFILGGFVAGDISMYVRLFSFGAFAVGIADAITVLLGLGGTPAASSGAVRVISSPSPTIRTPSSFLPPSPSPPIPQKAETWIEKANREAKEKVEAARRREQAGETTTAVYR
jgi:hypothetical protein